jgi:hypothetical protein
MNGPNLIDGWQYDGWDVIIKNDGLVNQFMTIGVKKKCYGRYWGAWTRLPDEFVKTWRDKYSDDPSDHYAVTYAAQSLIARSDELSEAVNPCETKLAWNDKWEREVNFAPWSKKLNYDSNYVQPTQWYGDWYHHYPNPNTGTADVSGWQWTWTSSGTPEIEREEEEEMGYPNEREKQIYKLFEMTAVDNIKREVIGEAWIAARSEQSANIKFANELGIDADLVGDQIDFYVTRKIDLYEPEEDLKVQKVKVVKE